MMNRRTFLIGSAALTGSMVLPWMSPLAGKTETREVKMKTDNPKNAAVIWYSQTGNTTRYGKLIARVWKKRGLKVTASDYRDIDPEILAGMDLIVMGSPVYYYEVPVNFRSWIEGVPRIDGIPVASYVSFGGEGGNQHNTAYSLLDLMKGRGGIPVAMELFGNMSAFAPTWSMGSTDRILQYGYLPNGETYSRVRNFAGAILDSVKAGKAIAVSKKTDYRELIKGSVSIKGTKLLIGNHRIDAKTCTDCGTCVEKCPVEAINLESHRVNTSRCIACMGCVNNCPNGAMNMTFMGKKVFGFNEFLKRNRVEIAEPEELRSS